MDLDGIMLSKILHDLTYMWNLKRLNSQKQRTDWWLPEARGRGLWAEGGQKAPQTPKPNSS